MRGWTSSPRVRYAVAGLVWLLPSLLTVIAFHTSLEFGLLGDAVFLIRDNAWMQSWGDLPGLLTHDYFWASSGEAIGYWRPVTKASWLLETILGRGDPGVYHGVQVAWFLVGIVGVQGLARVLGFRPMQAMAVALLVGLHPAAVEPVCLVMARSDVVAMTGMIWAVLFWLLGWKTGRRGWLVPQLLALALALGSKELAVVSPAVFAGFWAVDSGWTAGWRRGLVALGPAALLVVGYLLTRALILGPSGGIGVAFEPFRWFAAGGMYLSGLVPFRVSTGVRNLPVVEAASAAAILQAIAAWGIALGITGWLALRSRRGLPFAAWMALVMAPVLLVGAINVPHIDGKFPLADRWLFHAVAPASCLWVYVVREFSSPWAGRVGAVGLAAWVVFSLAMSAETHHWYQSSETLMELEDRRYAATPARFRTAQDDCAAFERRLLADMRVAGDAPIPDLDARVAEFHDELRCEDARDLHFNLASYYVRIGDYGRARPLLRGLLADGRTDRSEGMLRLLVGIVEVRAGDPATGLTFLGDARCLGLDDCRIPMEEALALRALGRFAESAQAFETAYRCRSSKEGVRDPNLLFAAAILHDQAGARETADGLVQELERVEMSEALRAAFESWKRHQTTGTDPGAP